MLAASTTPTTPTASVALLTDVATLQRLESLDCQALLAASATPTKTLLPVLLPVTSIENWQHSTASYLLAVQQGYLKLIPAKPNIQPLVVDFTAGTTGFRGQQNVRNELLVKALLGRKKQQLPSVLDATAGLGRDSFLMAMLGCSVLMTERNLVVQALLADGLMRLDMSDVALTGSMRLLTSDFFVCNTLQQSAVDVVYLDPMFPQRQKSALVKKEMQIFKDIVGADDDSDHLLAVARTIAKARVIVKRPSRAPFLADTKPAYSVTGRSSRFDVYQAA